MIDNTLSQIYMIEVNKISIEKVTGLVIHNNILEFNFAFNYMYHQKHDKRVALRVWIELVFDDYSEMLSEKVYKLPLGVTSGTLCGIFKSQIANTAQEVNFKVVAFDDDVIPKSFENFIIYSKKFKLVHK